MVTIGLRKLIAVASASGIRAAAANMQVTPIQPQAARPKCSRQGTPCSPGQRIAATVTTTRKAKKNRPALICIGCSPPSPAPNTNALANSDVTAISALAPSMASTAMTGRSRAATVVSEDIVQAYQPMRRLGRAAFTPA